MKDQIAKKIESVINGKLSDAFAVLIVFEVTQSKNDNGKISRVHKEHSLKAVEDNGSVFQEKTEIKEGAKYLLFLQSSLSVVPKINMKIEFKGLKYLIKKVSNDPLDVTWTVRVELI